MCIRDSGRGAGAGGAHAAAAAEGQGAMHVAGRIRLCTGQIVIGIDPVAVGVVFTSRSRQHAGYGATCRLHKPNSRGGFGEDGTVLRAAGHGMYRFHQRRPQGRGRRAARGVAFQRPVVVRTNPYSGGIIAAHARERHAGVVGMRAGLAGDFHAAEVGARAGAHAGGDAALEHVHQHPGRGFLEHLSLIHI